MTSGGFNLLSLVLLLVVFYFFLIMPEQRKQKKVKAMMSSLKVGDTVVTRGGIYGKIANIKEDLVTIESGPSRVKIDVTRQGIGTVVEAADSKPAETEKIIENSEEKAE